MDSRELEKWIRERVASELGVAPDSIDVTQSFEQYGLDSASVVEISGELETILARRLEPTLLFEYPSISALVAGLSGGKKSRPWTSSGADAELDDAVAIVGLACRFPGAEDPDAFWRLLETGSDAISEFPRDRWNRGAFEDANSGSRGRSGTLWGGFLKDIRRFDHRFFGMTPAEAIVTDPQQRLILELSWEALEDGGFSVERLAGSSVGVFVGVSANDYGRRVLNTPEHLTGYAGTGNALSIVANRISYQFDFRGPSIAVDTACSSSLVAVALAAGSVRSGESHIALAAGVNLLLSPQVFTIFDRAGMMAPDGRCKTFDSRANGYVRGEGGGVVLLRRLNAALRDGNRIYAVVRGWAVNQDGRTNGLTAPNPDAQEAVLAAAYHAAKTDPRSVGYVEAHGTGTFLGDPIEAKSLAKLIGGRREHSNPCFIGSVKTNIGHLEAAAGIAGVIKVALMLEKGVIPPSLHFKSPNPHIPFENNGLAVPTKPIAFPSENGAETVAGVSGFGFGGTNAHLVLGSAPVQEERRAESCDQIFLLPLSARTRDALTATARLYEDWLETSKASLQDICFAAAGMRSHHQYRLAAIGQSKNHLREQLRSVRHAEPFKVLAPAKMFSTSQRKVAFVFSGQGCQWPCMALNLMERFPVVAEVIEKCAALFEQYASWSLIDELRASSETSRLESTEIAQPAIFSIQLAIVELWRWLGITPDMVVGHGLGEIIAATAAGALEMSEAARIVFHRARLMQETFGNGRMLAVELAAADAEKTIGPHFRAVSLAAVNGPNSSVLSGEIEPLEEIARQLEGEGVPCRWLPINYAFHSQQMECLVERFSEEVKDARAKDSTVPFYSTVTGGLLPTGGLTGAYWCSSLPEPVRFAEAFDQILKGGCTLAIEIGGQPMLQTAIAKLAAKAESPGFTYTYSSSKKEPYLEPILRCIGLAYVQGAQIRWERLFDTVGKRVSLPKYPWQREEFWIEAEASSPSADSAEIKGAPLLGRRLELAGDDVQVWLTRLPSARTGYFGQHQVLGHIVFPAAGYVEMALEALNECGLGHALIREFRISEPMFLSEELIRDVQVRLQRIDRSILKFRVYSRGSGDEAWRLHAGATIALDDDQRSAGPEESGLVAAQARCFEQIATSDLYSRLAQRGLKYGPVFRRIHDIWRRDGESLARIDPSNETVSDEYIIHPALLDSCIHVIAAALPETVGKSGMLALPVALEEFQLLGSLKAGGRIHVVLREENQQTAESLKADLYVFDEGGKPVARAVGFEMRALRESAPVSASRGAKTESWLYQVEWRLKTHSITTAHAHENLSPSDRWVIFEDRVGVGAEVARRLGQMGQVCIRVNYGQSYSDAGDVCVLNPSDSDQLRRFVRSKLVKDHGVKGLVYCWTIDADAKESADAQRTAMKLSADGLLELAKAIAIASGGPPRLWIVTRGAESNEQAEVPVSVFQAPARGLSKAIALELPDLRCVTIDLDSVSDTLQNASNVLEELLATNEDNQVIFLGRQRYVPRLVLRARDEIIPGEATDKISLASNGTYMITGGFGGLGLSVAQWLVEKGARNLVLLGRQFPSQEAANTIERLATGGVTIRVAAVDVSDREALKALFDEINVRMPAVRGIFHLAGVRDDGAILELDASRLGAVMSPKVWGALNLHQLTRDLPLDFFVMFSSAASVLGSPGQANYIAANSFMDALSHQRRVEGKKSISINWGPWADIGMATDEEVHKRFLETGIRMISPKQGLRILEQLLTTTWSQVVVLPFDVATLLHLYPTNVGMRFFEELFDGDLDVVRSIGTEIRYLERPDLPNEFIAPGSETETLIAGIWQRGLGIDRVGVHDGFFELGGDSVFAGQIIIEINKVFSTRLDPEKAFADFTVARLAEMVEQELISDVENMSDEEVKGELEEVREDR